jgi:putative Holliday junction resolvase
MNIMAFDAGTVRIGVAVGDDSLKIALPVKYVDNNPTLVSAIQKLFEEYAPGFIIVGNPLNMDGTKNPNTKFADDLAEIIKAISPGKKLIMWDERLTSAEAGEVMVKNDVSRKKRKKSADKIAAALILQSYFDNEGKGCQ